jgi:hypothetical protein
MYSLPLFTTIRSPGTRTKTAGLMAPSTSSPPEADRATSVTPRTWTVTGDADVLSASYSDDKIAWYENQGGWFDGTQHVITTQATGAYDVFAIDLDGDGDADVLSASAADETITWYENQGGWFDGTQHLIAASVAGSVYATDLDGDGDADVLSAFSWNLEYGDGAIAWYENQGGWFDGTQHLIPSEGAGARSVYATDLDGDGDADVLSASGDGIAGSCKVAWYENLSDELARDNIIGRAESSGDWWLARSDGTSFTNEKWGSWSSDITWEHVLYGDFNGNGQEDIVGRDAATGRWYVSTSSNEGLVTKSWGIWSTNVSWEDVAVGDFNGDGLDDSPAVSAPVATGGWLNRRARHSAMPSGDAGRPALIGLM